MEKQATVRWVEGLQFVANPPSNHAILLDGSGPGGGADSAVHPKELLLCAVAGCTGMDVISILNKMKVQVKAFEMTVSADEAEEHPKYYRSLKVTYVVRGENIPEDKVKKAVDLSSEKYCGVMATLRHPVEVNTEIRIENC